MSFVALLSNLHPWSIVIMFVCCLLPIGVTINAYDISIFDTFFDTPDDPSGLIGTLDAFSYKGCMSIALIPAPLISLILTVGGESFLSRHIGDENAVAGVVFIQLLVALLFLLWGCIWLFLRYRNKSKRMENR